jgi:hypothetical protein
MSRSLALASIPLSARQRIVVVEDRVALAERAAAAKAAAQGTRWERIVRGDSALDVAVDSAHRAYSRIRDARKRGLGLLSVGQREAGKLVFPPGHPLPLIVYVRDPTDTRVYWPGAEFHLRAFERKFADAMHLLMALSATDIMVAHEKGWDAELAAEMKLGLPLVPSGKREVSQRRSGRAEADREKSIMFEAHLNPGRPHLARNIAWLPYEPLWQQIQRGRLLYGLQKFDLVVNYTSDFGINGDFKARVKSAKLALGGSFVAHTSTEWRLQGEFNQRPAGPFTRLRARRC